MPTIDDIQRKYAKNLDRFDLDILIAHAIGKSREFVLAHPKQTITNDQLSIINKMIGGRLKSEPVAYILGYKEFFGLDFKVNKYTLVPRPETELLVEFALDEISNLKPCLTAGRSQTSNLIVLDIGTGSGNIIISIAKAIENFEFRILNFELIGTDISKNALKIARQNAKTHKVDKKIKFLHGNLLDPVIGNLKLGIRNSRMIILANLPYLSEKIYNDAPVDVKNFEPKSALWSDNAGLSHYENLLEQIKKFSTAYSLQLTAFLEFSPEQKNSLEKMINQILPQSEIKFHKDLAGKWRMAKISL